MDKKKKQVTLLGPGSAASQQEVSNPADLQAGKAGKELDSGAGPLDVLAPRMFAFDGVFTDEDPQLEMCTASLPECIQALLSGTDSTLFSFGHCSLGKRYTMIGEDASNLSVGIIPTAIGWIFRCIRQIKDKPATRLIVKMSALEISGQREEPRDLLVNLREESQEVKLTSASTSVCQSLTQLRAGSVEKAGQILDYIIANRQPEDQGGSHLLVTVHMYQLHPSTDQVLGKSQLNLIDFGSCQRNLTRGGCITQAGLGHVILGILNGQKHLPFRESKVTSLLRECLGPVRSIVCMVAHVTPSPAHYSETLHTVQLASRIHRIRRKKKTGGSSGGSGSGSSEENRKLSRLARLPGYTSSDLTTSTDPSSSEQSTDTVIYLGPRDDDGTDMESPPVYLPTLNSGDHRGLMSCVLRGSSAELPLSKYRSLDRKSSPRYSSLGSSQSPGSSQAHTPVPPPLTANGGGNSQLSTPVRRPPSSGSGGRRCGSLPRNTTGKMPLYGKVAGYKQPSTNSSGKSDNSGGTAKQEIWIDSVPDGQQDVIQVQYNDTQGIYGYGYMDEHKKRMIQQWVEGQTHTLEMGPPSHLTGKDSLAWLEAHSKEQKALREQNEYKILTQFKVAESSTSSTPSISQADEEMGNEVENSPDRVAGIKLSPNHRWTRIGESSADYPSPSHSNSSTFKPRLSMVQTADFPPNSPVYHSQERISLSNSNTGHIRSPLSLHQAQVHVPADPKSGRKESPQEKPAKPIARKSADESAVSCDDVISAGGSSKESRTSADRGTSTSENPENGEGKTLYPRSPRRNFEQDPYRAQRKLPLRRESINGEGMKTLDELFSHCEQLVETLSQASEELRQQCPMSPCSLSNPGSPLKTSADLQMLTVYDLEDEHVTFAPSSHVRSYAEGELYPLSEGSEASIEVADRSCQVSESQILTALAEVSQPPPASWQQPQPPLAGLSPKKQQQSNSCSQNKSGSSLQSSTVKTAVAAASTQNDDVTTKNGAKIVEDDIECAKSSDAVVHDDVSTKAMVESGLDMLKEDDHERRRRKDLDILDLQGVPEEVLSVGEDVMTARFDQLGEDVVTARFDQLGEDVVTARFDQLAKLHQLYQSVSSINAKCQTRLTHERQKVGGSCITGSLSVLPVYSTDGSICSSLSEDLNSLCSEPAWLNSALLQHQNMKNSNHGSPADDTKNSTLSLNFLDFNTFTKGINTVSLSSLCSQNPSPPPPPISADTQGESSNKSGLMELSVASMSLDTRCDSPILEGIDSELAKYAKLRDLHQAYNPRKSKVIKPFTSCDIADPMTRLRHPDGIAEPFNSSRHFGEGTAEPITSSRAFREGIAEPLAKLRHPDGSSNPDLNLNLRLDPDLRIRSNLPQETSLSLPRGQRSSSSHAVKHPQTSEMSGNKTAAEVAVTGLGTGLDPANRSPGTGRSSSGSDGEEATASRLNGGTKLAGLDSTHSSNIYIRDRSISRSSETPPHRTGDKESPLPRLGDKELNASPWQELRRNHTESPSRQSHHNQQQQQSPPQLQPDKSSESTKTKTSKTPRFSRLFGGGGKKSGEEKRCKSGRHSKHKQEQRLCKESRFKFPAHKSCEALLNDGPNGGKLSQNGGKLASPSKASKIQSEESKNAKGTLSSEHCFENGGYSKRKSRNIFKGLRKSSGVHKSTSAPRPQNGCQHDAVSAHAHSATVSAHTNNKNCEDGNNSGYDSGVEVKPRGGKGAACNSDLNLRIYKPDRKHCKSSGYESIGLDSERDSLDSCQGTLNYSSYNRSNSTSSRLESVLKTGGSLCRTPGSGRKPGAGRTTGNRMSPVSILEYDQEKIAKLDSHWRIQEYQRLRKEQDKLKIELEEAKKRINVDTNRWSFDLYTAQSFTGDIDELDVDYLEALQQETSILAKRVTACQARATITTCFQGGPPTSSGQDKQTQIFTGCTTDCDIITNTKESALF